MPTTLFDIQKKYGESVYPLYKDESQEPYMENDLIENKEKKLVVKAKEIHSKTNSIFQTANTLGIDVSTTSNLLKQTPEVLPDEVSNGYKGVVLYDELEDKIMCNECGKWFSSLTKHTRGKKKGHNMTLDKYRNKYGILKKATLSSKALSKIRSISAKKRMENRSLSSQRKQATKMNFLSPKQRSKIVNNFTKKAQYKNKKGVCDAQIAARLIIVKKQSNKNEIFSGDIQKNDRYLYDFLRHKYGTVKVACKALGIKAEGSGGKKQFEDAELIAKLRNWVIVHQEIPNSGEKWPSELPADDTYTRYFGSMRRAKMMAGLDQLLNKLT